MTAPTKNDLLARIAELEQSEANIPRWMQILQPRTPAEAEQVRREVAEIRERVRAELGSLVWERPYRSTETGRRAITDGLCETEWQMAMPVVYAMEWMQ